MHTRIFKSKPINIISIYFVSSNSVLLINAEGKLKKLYTPFRVICTEPCESLTVGTRLYVEEVYLAPGAVDKSFLGYYSGRVFFPVGENEQLKITGSVMGTPVKGQVYVTGSIYKVPAPAIINLAAEIILDIPS